MFNFSRVCLAAALVVPLFAAPALAVPDRLGSVYIVGTSPTQTTFAGFDGGIELLGFRGSSPLYCESITAFFADGSSYGAYSGYLEPGRPTLVGLPKDKNDVRRVDFNCRAEQPIYVELEVLAEIGAHRNEWRQSSNWDSKWSYRFDWANEPSSASN